MAMMKEFKEFALKGSVVDLAVGVVIGAAFGKIVDSLVKDVIMPPIGLALGRVDFSNLFITLKEGAQAGPYASVKAAADVGAVTLNIGLFVNTLISFAIVAGAIFVVVKAMNRMKRQQEAAPPPRLAEPPEDVKLLREIRDALKK